MGRAALVLALTSLIASVATAAAAPPGPPTLLWPASGEQVADDHPPLVFLPALDPDGDPLIHTWELAGDDRFAPPLDGGAVAASASVIVVEPAVALAEDTATCWRVRADDGHAPGPWVSACFRVSVHDDPPSVPVLNSPSDNQGATTTDPVFSWQPSIDPEGGRVSYDVEVEDDRGLVDAVHGVTGTLTGLPAVLANGASYRWRARAVDAAGHASAFAPWSPFTVNAVTCHCSLDPPDDGGCAAGGGAGPVLALVLAVLACALRRPAPTARRAARLAPLTPVALALTTALTITSGTAADEPPGPPTLTWPLHATTITELQPALRFTAAVDPEGAPRTDTWQLARTVDVAVVLDGGPAPAARVTPAAPLVEDQRACWRVRADDGHQPGPWATACFLAPAVDGPPTAPTPLRPAAGEPVHSSTPVFEWAPSVDPEGEPVTYELEVWCGDRPCAVARGIVGHVGALAAELANHAFYRWRVRAIDAGGVVGPFSEPVPFELSFDGDEVDVILPGQACCSAGGGRAGDLPAPLAVALAVLVRRRPRRG